MTENILSLASAVPLALQYLFAEIPAVSPAYVVSRHIPMFAMAFFPAIILAYAIRPVSLDKWKETILLRSAIAFSLGSILCMCAVLVDDIANPFALALGIIVLALFLLSLILVCVPQKHKLLSIFILTIPYDILIIVNLCGGYFIMS